MLYLKKCGELYDEKHMMTGKVIEKAKITRDFLRKVIKSDKCNNIMSNYLSLCCYKNLIYFNL